MVNTWNISPKDQISYDHAKEPEPYGMSKDAYNHPGTPEGTLTAYQLDDCSVYPGVKHRYWIYVPAQYQSAKPAALMFFLDGLTYVDDCHANIVMDNLIAAGEMLVTIGVFVEAGDKGPGYP